MFYATHAGILTPARSSRPSERPSPPAERSPTMLTYVSILSFGAVLEPRYIIRATAFDQ
jgi:hypothetical protein